MRMRYNSWLVRDLSIQGRLLLSKAEGLSRAANLFLRLVPQGYMLTNG